jgi:hypothetical protein
MNGNAVADTAWSHLIFGEAGGRVKPRKGLLGKE